MSTVSKRSLLTQGLGEYIVLGVYEFKDVIRDTLEVYTCQQRGIGTQGVERLCYHIKVRSLGRTHLSTETK